MLYWGESLLHAPNPGRLPQPMNPMMDFSEDLNRRVLPKFFHRFHSVVIVRKEGTCHERLRTVMAPVFVGDLFDRDCECFVSKMANF